MPLSDFQLWKTPHLRKFTNSHAPWQNTNHDNSPCIETPACIPYGEKIHFLFALAKIIISFMSLENSIKDLRSCNQKFFSKYIFYCFFFATFQTFK